MFVEITALCANIRIASPVAGTDLGRDLVSSVSGGITRDMCLNTDFISRIEFRDDVRVEGGRWDGFPVAEIFLTGQYGSIVCVTQKVAKDIMVAAQCVAIEDPPDARSAVNIEPQVRTMEDPLKGLDKESREAFLHSLGKDD